MATLGPPMLQAEGVDKPLQVAETDDSTQSGEELLAEFRRLGHGRRSDKINGSPLRITLFEFRDSYLQFANVNRG